MFRNAKTHKRHQAAMDNTIDMITIILLIYLKVARVEPNTILKHNKDPQSWYW